MCSGQSCRSDLLHFIRLAHEDPRRSSTPLLFPSTSYYQCSANAKLKMVGPMSAWILEGVCWMPTWNSPNPHCLSPPSYWFTKINEVTTLTLSNMPFLKYTHSTFYVPIWIYISKTYTIVHIVLRSFHLALHCKQFPMFMESFNFKCSKFRSYYSVFRFLI